MSWEAILGIVGAAVSLITAVVSVYLKRGEEVRRPHHAELKAVK